MTAGDELREAEGIIREAESWSGKDVLAADSYRDIIRGLARVEAGLRRLMTEYAAGGAGLSVSEVYLASELLERLHEAGHNLPPFTG